jgi:ubiquinone biosynthesis protein
VTRDLRVVRVLRVGVALGRVLPRYLLLLARERSGVSRTTPADWNRAHAAAAREVRRVALSLAGAFTKAAQILGARADFMPAPFIDELSQFHDAVPPRPFETLAPLVERDLGRKLGDAFAAIDREALAAASLAQVHRATLPDGRRVAVKIQYPEIRRIIPLDLGMLRRIVGMVQRLQRRIDLSALVNEVTRFIELELDFAREVRSTERLARTLEDFPDVVVPRVVRELCGENVIVLEYLEGIQVARTGALVAAGHPLPEVARKIGALYGSMIFEHDFFHGDPHPGNLLVLPDGRIGLLDFGLCKELPPGFARLVAVMMVSAMIGDSDSALAAAEALGFDTASLRPEHLRSLMLMAVGDSDGDEGLLDILGESRVRRIPEDFALVARTLILLNGLSHRLAPGRRLIQAELLQHLAAGASRDWPARGAAGSSERPRLPAAGSTGRRGPS